MNCATSEELLIIFAKNPQPGKVKTRLAAAIGEEAAAEIYKLLLEQTLRAAKNISAHKAIYFAEEIGGEFTRDHKIFSKYLQKGQDLGARMENSFRHAFSDNYKRVIIIGTDLWEISQPDLEEAFTLLRKHDVVLGPAKDGGYYLLGMKSLNSKVFKNKKWSTASVLQETLQDLRGQDIYLLETRNDIDELKDIENHPVFRKFIE